MKIKNNNDFVCRTDKTISAYDRNATSYLIKFGNYQSYRDRIMLFHQRYMKDATSILDLGCGPGHNTSLLLDLAINREVTGVDLSEKFIEIARQREPRATFLTQDIRHLDVGKQQYDTIIASFCIVHLTFAETTLLLEKLSTLLTGSGCLYLSFMEGTTSGFEKTSFSKDEIYFQYHQIPDIQRILLKSGMVVREIHTDDYQEDSGDITQDIFMFAQKTG